jgi:hypothetical protein
MFAHCKLKIKIRIQPEDVKFYSSKKNRLRMAQFEGYASDSYVETMRNNITADVYDGDEMNIWVPKAACSSNNISAYDDESYVAPIEEPDKDPQIVSCAQYFANKFGCHLHTSKLMVPDTSFQKYSDIFPFDVLNAFTIEYIEPKLRQSICGARYNGVCDKQDYAVMVKYLREHFPLFALTSFERHPELAFVNYGTFTNHHEFERHQFSSSLSVRSVDKPDIVNVYRSAHDESVYIWQSNQPTTQTLSPEDLLIDHMQTRAKWVSMPDIKLLEVPKFESQSAIKLLSLNRDLLRNVNVIISLASTPSYIDAFTLYKNLHEIEIGSFYPHTFLFRHLQNLEKIYVYGSKTIEESLPFVFRVDNPICCLTDISPETQDKILSHVTFGISDMIDYSRGAYLSGSMISAAIQFIKNGDYFLLESNYPRVHTELCYSPDIAGNEYETLRAFMCALKRKLACVTVTSKTEDLVSFTFSCDPNDVTKPRESQIPDKWKSSYDMILYEYRMVARFTDETMAKANDLISAKAKVKFVFRISAGCDIDVPVRCSDNPENVQMVAVDLLTKMSAKWPGACLSVVTKNRKTPMYRITTNSVLERISGFRDVEIYPAIEPRTQIASYHVNAVRAWKGPLHGIYATASAIMGHVNGETSHHHYFAGKEKPWRVLDKYVSRGFGTFGMKVYNDLRKNVDTENPLHDIYYIKSTSAIGITGNFNLFAHLFNPLFTLKMEDGVITKEMFNFGELEKFETYRQRTKRISQ